MKNITVFQNDILTLAAQLERLLKVINHSDPSAETKKHLLYDKYKSRLSGLSQRIKCQFSWAYLQDYLLELYKSNDITIDTEVKDIIFNKLLKDFENEFVSRHVLTELSPPEPTDSRQKERIKSIRKRIRENRKSQKKVYTRENLMEMVQLRNQQRDAKKSLDKLVNAINKIDSSDLETYIKKTINSEK